MSGAQHQIEPPQNIAGLRRNPAGYPIPFFVPDRTNPDPNFRTASSAAYRLATLAQICWVCGQRRAFTDNAFVIGPMCAVNRISVDPPAHAACALYSVQVCPFLSRPEMVRREGGMPPTTMPGMPILRNPGVSLIWVAPHWQLHRLDDESGFLFDLGEPSSTSWWARGRPATRAEVVASMESGLPTLEEACTRDPDPGQSRVDLARAVQRALAYLPPES